MYIVRYISCVLYCTYIDVSNIWIYVPPFLTFTNDSSISDFFKLLLIYSDFLGCCLLESLLLNIGGGISKLLHCFYRLIHW